MKQYFFSAILLLVLVSCGGEKAPNASTLTIVKGPTEYVWTNGLGKTIVTKYFSGDSLRPHIYREEYWRVDGQYVIYLKEWWMYGGKRINVYDNRGIIKIKKE